MKLQGNDMTVMVYADGVYQSIAYARTCELDIESRMVEVGCALTGKWRRLKKRGLQWTSSTMYLMAEAEQSADILRMAREKARVAVVFGTIERVDDGMVLNNKVKISGEALLTSARVTAQRGDVVTMAAELVGQGRLVELMRPWILASGKWSMSGIWINKEIWR